MSLYNMMNGTNKFAPLALGVLANEVPGESFDLYFPRIRDAWFEREDGRYQIRVHTRAGGGNRDEYQDDLDALSVHPWWLRDEDCEHDSTYCDIVFCVPDEVANQVTEKIKDGLREQGIDLAFSWADNPVNHRERLDDVLRGLVG